MLAANIGLAIGRPFDANQLLATEWLVTNGLGGYASGTVLGPATRRYHGMFIPNLPSPFGRTNVMPCFEDSLFVDGERIPLTGPEFRQNHRRGHLEHHLQSFALAWRMPTWRFQTRGRVFEKTIFMPHGFDGVVVRYAMVEGDPLDLKLRPFFSFRLHDGLLGHPPAWPFVLDAIGPGQFSMTAFEGAPLVYLSFVGREPIYALVDKTHEDVYYRIEDERGDDCIETLRSPIVFEAELSQGNPITLFITTQPPQSDDPERLIQEERERLDNLLARTPPFLRAGLAGQLVLAADQFVVFPGSRLEEAFETPDGNVRTVIAGYHWFSDWGRDTMISLEGLTLCTGRFQEARAILQTFSRYVHHGLIPNLFPEGKRTGLYHTVDATLWYFHAIQRYLHYTNDFDTLRGLYPVLESILEIHYNGTDFGIRMDPVDGLLHASTESLPLTWMDAKVSDWVVTPRRGKPVEIQALWYNALRLMEGWAKPMGQDATPYATIAARVHASFNRKFWHDSGKYLKDVVDGENDDDLFKFRPNQIFAVSLAFPVLAREHWKPVVDGVAKRLLTPYGLRTLDREHPEYRARYEGDRWARDGAYHQGMVWAWLIGPFLDAWQKVYADRKVFLSMLEGFERHLSEAGIGSISEIFDAEPPYLPRGCIAQAWSVAETLRSLYYAGQERERLAVVVQDLSEGISQ